MSQENTVLRFVMANQIGQFLEESSPIETHRIQNALEFSVEGGFDYQ